MGQAGISARGRLPQAFLGGRGLRGALSAGAACEDHPGPATWLPHRVPSTVTGGLSRAGGEEALEGGRPGHAGEAPPLQLGHRRVTCSSRGSPPSPHKARRERPALASSKLQGRGEDMLQSSDWAPWWGGSEWQRRAEGGRNRYECPVLPAFLQRPWAQLHEANQKPREEVGRQLWAVRFCSGRAWGG